MDWTKKPLEIKSIPNDIDYIMCIDENNYTNRIKYVLKQIAQNKEINEDDRYFTITGCIFTKQNYLKSHNSIEKIKNKYWNNGIFTTSNGENKKVCLHSRDIRRKEHPFLNGVINYSYDEFMNDLSDTLKEIECNVISINVNFYEYLKKGYTIDVYSIAFDFLLERYIISTKNNKKGIIVLESRGKKENSELLSHIDRLINKTGTRNINSTELNNKIKGVYFNTKWNEDFSVTFTGLEITDLFSYPIHKFIKYGIKDKAFEIIELKLSCYPEYKNKGIKLFP